MSIFTRYPETADLALQQVKEEEINNEFHGAADKLIRVLESLILYPHQNPEREKFIKTESGWSVNPEWKNICKSKCKV